MQIDTSLASALLREEGPAIPAWHTRVFRGAKRRGRVAAVLCVAATSRKAAAPAASTARNRAGARTPCQTSLAALDSGAKLHCKLLPQTKRVISSMDRNA